MRNQKRGKQIRYYIAVAAAAGMLLTLPGCSIGKKDTAVAEGMAAVEALDYQTALASFEKAMVDGEDLKLIYRGQGLAYMGLTQYEEAAAALEKALASSNGQLKQVDYDINYYLATAYSKLGKTDQCARVYDAMIALKPKEQLAYYLRGVIRIESDFEKAREDFEQALKLSGGDQDLLIRIYQVMEQHGYREAGVEYLTAALEKKGITDYEAGRIYYYMRDYDNARNHLEKARNTEGYEAVLLLGRTYEALGEGEYNYAVSVYQSFLEKDQTRPEVYNQLGICKLKMGLYQEALGAFQAGMNIENNEMLQTLKFNEIITYEYLGEFKQASVLMDNYLKTYPDDETAAREFVFLQTR